MSTSPTTTVLATCARTAGLVIALAALLAGCQTRDYASETVSETVAAQVCGTPRPEVCTHQYDPVCAVRDTGPRCPNAPCPDSEWKTYGNACTACSDPNVLSYEPGACAEREAEQQAEL